MTEHWHGAQWVMATWFVIMTFLPTFVRVGMRDQLKTPKPLDTWLGEELQRWTSRWILIFILYWGGFWG